MSELGERLLTDRALVAFGAIAALGRVGGLVFLAYAISRHVAWTDAAAIAIAYGFLLRALTVRA